MMRTNLSIGIIVYFLLITSCGNDKAQTPLAILEPTTTATGVITTIQPQKRIVHPTVSFGDPTRKPSTTAKTPTRMPTFTQRIELSYTSTPMPSLKAHNWIPETILVLLTEYGGDGCCSYPSPPELILYSDGQLFVRNYENASDYIPRLLTKKLNRQDMCALINTIDQLGFFDYDVTTYEVDRYERPINYYPIDGSSSAYISVKAWQSNTATVYGLSSFLYNENYFQDWPNDRIDQPPTILPALKNTYLFLTNYEPENLVIAEPEKIEVWIKEPYPVDEVKTWSLENPTLEFLINNAQLDHEYNGLKIILEGKTAKKVYQMLGESLREQVFTDGENTVLLYTFPLLPYSYVLPYSSERSDSQPTPTPFILACDPSDGQVPYP